MKTKKLATVGVAALASLLLASCGSTAAPASDEDAPLATEANAATHEKLPEEVKERGEIVFATTSNNSPYTFKTGSELDGMLVDLGQELEGVLGVKVTWAEMSFPGLIPAIQAEKADAIWSLLTSTPEREEAGDMLAFMKNSSGFITMTDSETSIEDRVDLCGLRLATVRGGTTQAYLEETINFCGAEGAEEPTLALFDDREAAQAQMRSGKVDAFSGITVPLRYVSAQIDNGAVFAVQPFQYGAGANSIMFPKGNEELVEAVQAGLQEVIESGRYDAIMAEYGSEGDTLTADQILMNPATTGALDDALGVDG